MQRLDEDVYILAEVAVYKEFTRKLCNIRIEEFISTSRIRLAAEKGNASTKEQNLRDALLTHHTKLMSHITLR